MTRQLLAVLLIVLSISFLGGCASDRDEGFDHRNDFGAKVMDLIIPTPNE